MRLQDSARSQRDWPTLIKLKSRHTIVPVAIALVVALSGCGGDPPALPIATADIPPAEATSSVSSPFPAARVTLEELFRRIQAGWDGETRFRELTTYTTEGTTGASPVVGKTGRTLREVFGPGQVRAAAEENGQLLFEILIDGNDVYLRGTIATLIEPALPSGEWLRTDQATVTAQPQLGASLISPIVLDVPTYHPPDRLLPQIVRLIGPTDDGCIAYAAADTTATGARVDFTIAVQPDGSLCRIETRSPGLASTYQVEPLADNATLELPTSYRDASPPAGTPSAAAPGDD